MATWNSTLPSGTKAFNLGDNDIRANFQYIEEALAREFTFPGTTGSIGTSMRPMEGSARIFTNALSPTQVSATAALDSGRVWAKQAVGLLQIYESAWKRAANATYAAGLPSGTDAYPGALGVDSDTGKSYVFNGTLWVPLVAESPIEDYDYQEHSATTFYNGGPTDWGGTNPQVVIPAVGSFIILVHATDTLTSSGGANNLNWILELMYRKDAGAWTSLKTGNVSATYVGGVTLPRELFYLMDAPAAGTYDFKTTLLTTAGTSGTRASTASILAMAIRVG